MTDTQESVLGRGEEIEFGPFTVQVPDRSCDLTDCDDHADGVVTFEGSDTRISCCIDCAPQFLEGQRSEWTPLAGGRSLPDGGEASV